MRPNILHKYVRICFYDSILKTIVKSNTFLLTGHNFITKLNLIKNQNCEPK